MQAPTTPEFFPSHGEEMTAVTVAPSPCDKSVPTFDSPAILPKPACPDTVDTQDASIARPDDSFVDNDRINEDEILEVIFVSSFVTCQLQ